MMIFMSGFINWLFFELIIRFLSIITSRTMPPKKSTRSNAPEKPKADPKDDSPVRATRTRTLTPSASKDDTLKKKIKDDAPPVIVKAAKKPITKATSQDKSVDKQKGKGKEVVKSSAKDDKKEPAKQSAKQAVKPAQLKKMTLKGSVPVDQFFHQKSSYKVYAKNGVVYATTLNQSNIMNNNNKFYILQVLQNESNASQFVFFTRWGRVGVPGQQAPAHHTNAEDAIIEYHRKLGDKTRGGYRVVEMNYQSQDKKQPQQVKQKKEKAKDEPQAESNLDKSVQDLIRLIFDMKMMNNQMKQIGYDAKKMPLGKLAKGSILRGYEALKGLMEEVKGKKRHEVIAVLSGNFYSQIPHDFGFSKMQNHILDTEQKVKSKLQMLQSLEDIQIFTKLLDQGNIGNDMNELDSNYLKLKTNLTPLDKDSETYKILEEYVQKTHGLTHRAYKLQVEEIFQISKEEEKLRYRTDIDNKQLLWHGSRLTNFVGILSQGLRIAPPEAPVTGYMFGKGVYFADMVTKSANYCFTNPTNNTALMLLCQVALGGINEKFYADYYANLLPPGKMSTKGCGRTAPNGGKQIDDVFVPCGSAINTGIKNTSLQYNQFIVYDIAQIKSRYLFRMKFNYSHRW